MTQQFLIFTYKTVYIKNKYSNLVNIYKEIKINKNNALFIKNKINLFFLSINTISKLLYFNMIKIKSNYLLNFLCKKYLIRNIYISLNKKINSFLNSLNILTSNTVLFKQQNQYNSIILEIRAGTGGVEASLFAFSLFEMYLKMIEKFKWKYQILNYSSMIKKAIKEVIISIKGNNIYSHFKCENGIHRVQRIPTTEAQGRIHTSTCSIVVLPEKKIKFININNKDIRIDVYRSSGPGGQSVNTTDSAVRILHIPTNIIVQCQNEKSQVQNKLTAMKVLQIKLQQYYEEQNIKEQSQLRKQIIQTSDRAEKIRTYNFLQDRCTDHRAGITIYNLNKLFAGNLANFIVKCIRNIKKKYICSERDLNSHDF